MPDAPSGALTVVADLHLEVSDHRGRTAAHLHNDGPGLVLDVEHPEVLVRALPRRMVSGDVLSHLAGLTFRVRSAGVDLGTVAVTGRGGTRVRPTAAGVGAAGRLLWHERPTWVAAPLAVLVLGVAALVRRRRSARPG